MGELGQREQAIFEAALKLSAEERAPYPDLAYGADAQVVATYR